MQIKFLGLLIFIFFFCLEGSLFGQDQKEWTIEECIDYALKANIQIRQSKLNNEASQVAVKQSKAARYPNLSFRASESFDWSGDNTNAGGEGGLQGSNSGNFSLSSSIPVYRGWSIQNSIKQSTLDYESSLLNTEYVKENIIESILAAFLQVLYTGEQLINNNLQVESTREQVSLAEERLRMSVISKSDYLQVKSQLSAEQYNLANAESQYQIARVNLMQIMEMPLSDSFQIAGPNMDSIMNYSSEQNVQELYSAALKYRPQIKRVALEREIAELGVKLAKASYMPGISLDASLGSGYYSALESSYYDQVSSRLNPAVMVSLSVPIYQRRQAKSGLELAKISVQRSELDEINIQNQLRKDIEQAFVDLYSARIQYRASLENYDASSESYLLAEEKYRQGMINSVDFLFEKNNKIRSESNLLRAKYNLVYSYKIIDFYSNESFSF